jgi:hypothetical protein
MNYFLHYERLIEKRKIEIPEGYVERHHILPKCQDGSDIIDNRVQLTAKEHLIAHLLLHKMYPKHQGLLCAANLMTNLGKNGSRKYAWLKKKFAEKMRAPKSPDNRKKISDTLKNKPFRSDETRERMRVAWTKRLNHFQSEETKKKIAETMTGKRYPPRSDEARRKMSEAKIGKRRGPPSDETRKKMSEAQIGRKRPALSDDHRKKISEGMVRRKMLELLQNWGPP